MLKPKLRAWLDEYDSYHRHPVNVAIHKVCIPLIVFHALAMLDWIRLFHVPGLPSGWTLSVGHLVFAAVVLWYLTLDVTLGIVMAVAFAPCLWIARWTPWWAVVAIAVFAWVVQLAGHAVWEKRSPAFLKNLLQTLIGPLFVGAVLTGAYRPTAAGVAAARTGVGDAR